MHIVLGAILAAAVPTQAQGLAPVAEARAVSRTLTWDDCVNLALSRNPDLGSALRLSQASRAAFYQSFNGLMPTATLSNSYVSGSAAAGKPAYIASAAAGLTLFDLGKVSNIKSASAALDAALASVKQASAALRYNLRVAYANVLFAEANVIVAQRILELRHSNAEMVSLRYDSGHEYKGNMMNVSAQRLQAEAALAQSQRSLRTARRNFARQLGLDDFEEVTATGTLTTEPPPPAPADSLALISARPDVQVQESVVRSAKAAGLSAQSPLWPSLSANYARTRGASATEFPAAPYGWTAGATLSYPLFGGGPTNAYYGVQASRRNIEKSEEDLRVTRVAAVADLETTWSAYASAFDQVRVQQAQLESSRQRNSEADVRYATGLLTFDNWSLIVSQRVSDEQGAVQSRRDAVIAQAAWEKALGKFIGE